MTLTVAPFSATEHRKPVVDVLLAVRTADPTFPPASAGSDASGLSEWLFAQPALARWSALEGDAVVGYVQVTPAHEYLSKHLARQFYAPQGPGGFAEISRLFVDPRCTRRGIGSRLLERACAFAWSQGYQPALAVVTTSTHAMKLYEREGMREVGSFDGIDGENRVYVDEMPPSSQAGP